MEKLSRNEIIDELLIGCAEEFLDYVEPLVDAIERGETREFVLAMDELDDMPETYAWLKEVL